MSDEFQGESGLKEDWDGTIVLARFEQQGRGNWALVLKSLSDPKDGEPEEEVDHFAMSVGGADKGWTSHDGGEEIMGATTKQKFQMNSTIQKFINRAIEAGAGDELRRRSAELYDRRGPMFAKLWEGLRFHWDIEMEARNVPNPDTPDGKPWVKGEPMPVMVPVKYLGVDNGQGKLPLAGSSSQPPTTHAPTSGPSTNGGEVSAEDLETLRLIAKTASSFGEFADAVMDNSDQSGQPFVKNSYVRKNLSKESWYQELRA